MPDNRPLAPVDEVIDLPEVRLADAADLPVPTAVPGRAATSREAREMLTAATGAPTREALAMTAAIPHARDEIDAATAAQLRARHGTRVDTVYGMSGDADAPLAIGVDRAAHDNLPDIVRKSVLGIDYDEDAAPVPVVPRWLAVYDLPNYMVEGIRALGRTTFKTFPCFRVHEAAAGNAGEDPLGSMRILANLQGRGPTPQGELDAMANWIRANGVPIEAGHIEFPIAIPDYAPRVILAGNETTSFLMVDEQRADGAPVDALYIYAWAGGRRHYLANPQDIAQLAGPARRRVAVPARPARRVGGPAPEEAALANIARLQRPTLQLSDGVSETARRQARRAAVKALPVAQDDNPEAIMAIRRAGFRPDGPQAEMRLKRTEGDGRVCVITRNPDFATGAFLLVVSAADGTEIHREAVNDVEALEAALTSPSPRP